MKGSKKYKEALALNEELYSNRGWSDEGIKAQYNRYLQVLRMAAYKGNG